MAVYHKIMPVKLSIIIPVYNEIDSLDILIEKILTVTLPNGIDREIIVVDDGSTDGAVLQLQDKHKADNLIEIIVHKKNLGKGEAVKSGIRQATGDYILIQDADLELDPSEYSDLISPVLTANAEVVYGSRFLEGGNNIPRTKRVANRLLTGFANILFGSRLTDEATAYKLFKKSLVENLSIESTGFEICAELTARFLRNGKKIYEVPISYHPRTKQDGKKLNLFSDGLKAIFTLVKYRIRRKVERM
jgi:dolichol-phosphate mannosyltransferase